MTGVDGVYGGLKLAGSGMALRKKIVRVLVR